MNHVKPKVTVLLAAYNGMEWLDEQVQTILSQLHVDINLVVSIDKSNDGTENYFKNLAKQDPRVFVLPTGFRYGGAGSNFYRLLRDTDFLSSDYISFADQDDLWNLDKLKFSIERIEETNSSAFSSNVTAFWNDGSTYLINKSQKQREWDYWFESAGPGCTFVLSKELAIDLKKFCLEYSCELNEFLLHDWFVYAFARVNGYKWHISPKSTMQYRQHENNQVGANNNLKAYIKRIAQLREGSYRSQIVILQRLLAHNNSILKIPEKGYFSTLRLLFVSCHFRRRLRDRIALQVFIILNLF